MRERRITMKCERPVHWEYSYHVPIMAEFGPTRSMQEEYTDAVIGNRMNHSVKTETRMDFLVREREEKVNDHRGILEAHHVQVWLMANRYTAAKSDRMIEQFTLEHLPSLSYFSTIKDKVAKIVMEEIGDA